MIFHIFNTFVYYNSLAEALEAVSKGYKTTVWSEVDDDVCFYGWVIESNGYPHTQGEPFFKCKESAFWGGRIPDVKEVRKVV